MPATRFISRNKQAWTTGTPLAGNSHEVVSFAYQVSMDVVDGRQPPAGEGMFRHYYECWRDFLNYILRGTRRLPRERIFMARLDIRKFYDSLPRYAINDSLLPKIEKAIGVEGKLAIAPLFLPEVKDSRERARKIVDWMCDQSFGYKYLNPITGKIESDKNESRGIPQGPDLSAYLANIALFPVDEILCAEVNRLNLQVVEEETHQGKLEHPTIGVQTSDSAPLGALYARYVDDIVIAARTSEDLNHLKDIIDINIKRLGLELSNKTEPLPPMSQEEAELWLTDRRGAGLGVYGIEDLPRLTFPLEIQNPLLNPDNITRNEALLLLHDPRLEDPNTPDSDIIEHVGKAYLASDELRHSDRVVAARHIWRVIVKKNDFDKLNCSQIALEFIRVSRDLSRKSSELESGARLINENGIKAPEVDDVDLIPAWANELKISLEGLEKFLYRQRCKVAAVFDPLVAAVLTHPQRYN